MSCNVRRWLWGLIPLLMLVWVTVLGEHERIERDLKAKAEALLRGNNLGWATVSFSGRDGVLSGRALDEGEPNRAFEAARRAWGVRYLANRADLVDKADTYVWTAQLRDRTVRLTGFYPNEAARKAIVGAAQATFPNFEIDGSRMKPARGVPNQDHWLGGISFGLKQLARLKNGGRVDLDGLSLAVEGEAEDLGAYRAVKTALASGLPQGARLKLDKVTPPVVRPFVWRAQDSSGGIQLRGYVPSERARTEIVEAARRAYPRARIDDRMEIAAGEPKDWQAAMVAALAKIGQLEQGVAEARDNALSIAGIAADEAKAEAVRRLIRSDVPASFRTTHQITFREPTPKPISPYVTAMTATAQSVVLTGHVPSEAAGAALVDLVRARLPGRAIDNRLKVGIGAPAGWQECTSAGVIGLSRLPAGSFELNGRRLSLISETTDAGLAGTVAGNVRSGAGSACDPEVRIALLQPPPPPPPPPVRNEAAEAEARRKAEAEAEARRRAEAEAEARRRAEAEAEARRRAEAEERRRAEAEAEARRRAEAEAEARRRAEEDARRQQAAALAQRRLEAQRCQQQLQVTAQDGVIRFARASHEIDRVSHATLDRLATVAKTCPGFQIEVEGHTDAEGTPERNQRLSDRRANAVTEYLIRAGVPAAQLVPVGYGQSRPIASNDTADGRAKNRRIDFAVKSQ